MAEPAALRRTAQIPSIAGVRLLAPTGRFILRGASSVIRAAAAALDIKLAARACRASHAQGRALLWLGPDEYLLLGAEPGTPPLTSRLEAALQGQPHALVDVSHRQTGLEVAGAHAVEILSSGCPLDLDMGAFPIDMCTRTVFAKAEIVLWRTAADAFRVEVWRSFTDYVARFLADAAREH
ncbi:MAG TPA: sarcosine oxidase subunit gamma family protein [Steroidobacteraceae bacterium]|jgi:sarcosine oxidase subunit gamma